MPGGPDWAGRYAAGESITSIARTDGKSRSAVRGWLARKGITIRDRAWAARVRARREGHSRVPRRNRPTLRDGTRARLVLALVAEQPGGMTVPRCTALLGMPADAAAQTRIGTVLRDCEAAGWAKRAGRTASGGWGKPPSEIWVITGPGREALAGAAPLSARRERALRATAAR